MLLLALLLGCAADVGPDYVGPGALQFDGPAPRNALFLSIDTLRRDRLDVHGAQGISPFLGQLATEGLVLDDHQQCSAWTAPGMACTLAGRSNLDLGYAPRLGGGGPGVPLPPEQKLLAHFLDGEGFWTGLVSGNSWLSPEIGTGAGYASYSRAAGTVDKVREVGLEALSTVERDQRWFLHLHHMEPHFPYRPPAIEVQTLPPLEPWPEDLRDPDVQGYWRDAWDTLSEAEQTLLQAHLQRLYEAEIRTLDAGLAQTWDELESGGWLDDTLVVVWSDHGEQIFEHGWKGHAHSLHSDENDAVAIFWSRNIVPGRHTGPTASIDLVPTVLTALGLAVPAQVTGMVVGTAPANRPRYAEVMGYAGTTQAVTVDGVKLHYRWDGTLSLYDRGTDRAENVDRYAISDPRVGALWDLLEPRVQALSQLIGEEPAIPGG